MKNYVLIDDWHKAWQWASVRCMASALALQGAWEAIPDDLRAQAPHGMVNHATEALLLLGLIGRLVKRDVDVVPPKACKTAHPHCPNPARKRVVRPKPVGGQKVRKR